jgi:hypothetical protein
MVTDAMKQEDKALLVEAKAKMMVVMVSPPGICNLFPITFCSMQN